ncbi:MAG: RecQ family ATP-dependent DNA helicase [Lentisphaerae bacterium]|nr:RecQ family ATP-dependent DNA helicase [Lentisphaerota bacterium]
MMTIDDALHRYFHFDDFLDHQRQIIEKITAGEDICVVMPTGAGKSLCYQLPVLMRERYSLIVSPLIALMADQVAALRGKGIPAAFINSSITFSEQLKAADAAARGEIKLLYVAPERLQTDFFRRFITGNPPEMLVVDEAHCISEWGHDFRPSYRRIGETANELGIRQICAFTATATPEVCNDIRHQLKRDNMELMVAGFRRPNLAFKVISCDGKKEAKLRKIEKILEKESKPTIIYAATRQAVDELAGLPGVVGYHAGMSIEERTRAQEYFMTAPAPVLAATNAFGMGIDRPDVRRVIHYQISGSLEAYYQEAGRAGRDGEAAECILFFSFSDCYIHKFLIEMNNPPPAVIRAVYRELYYRTQDMGKSGEIEVKPSELREDIPAAKGDGQISAALGILEKLGFIRRSAKKSGTGTIRFTGDPDHLRILHQDEKTQRSRFIHRVLTRYGRSAVQEFETNIDELAQIAGLNTDQIKRVINALDGDCLVWKAGFSGRAVELTDPELRMVELDDAELGRHLNYELDRLEEMVDYAKSHRCRQVELVRYFGENSGKWQCGCCDNCSGKSNINEAAAGATPADIRLALRGADSLNGRVGIGKLSQILAGSRSASIMAGNWHRNACFGALGHLKPAAVEKLLRILCDTGYLERIDRNGYPCVRISPSGRKKLMGIE